MYEVHLCVLKPTDDSSNSSLYQKRKKKSSALPLALPLPNILVYIR